MAKFQSETLAATTAANALLRERILGSMHIIIKDYDKGIQRKSKIIDSEVMQLKEQVQDLIAQNKRLYLNQQRD